MEVGGFEEHRRRCVVNLGIRAAHDARKPDGVLCVGDDEHGRLKGAFCAVERFQRLIGTGGAHDDGVVAHLTEVESVEGLTVFQHDIVGDVHDVVDGAQACLFECVLHPTWGLGDLGAVYERGGVAEAEVGVCDLDFRLRLNGRVVFWVGEVGFGYCCAGEGGDLVGDAED